MRTRDSSPGFEVSANSAINVYVGAGTPPPAGVDILFTKTTPLPQDMDPLQGVSVSEAALASLREVLVSFEEVARV